MKRLMLPLKLTTEAIWTAGRVARSVRDALRGGKGASPQSKGGAPRGASTPDVPSGILSEAALASATVHPAEGFAPGTRVVAPGGLSANGRSVPPRGIGRVASARDGLYDFLFYGDDGIPVLISGVKGDALRGL